MPRRPHPAVLKYYLWSATTHPGFIWPVFTLYLLYKDVTYTQIGILFTLEAVLIVLGEIPTGFVGDRIGRRNSLLISQVLWTLVPLGFVLSTDFPGFVLTFVGIAFATTFVSGSGDAWLYDILEERVDEGRFVTVKGRGGSVNKWVAAVAMIVGAVLYVLRPDWPYYAAAALSGFGLLVLFTFPKNAQFDDTAAVGEGATEADPTDATDGDREGSTDADGDDRFTVIDALPLIRETLTRPPLRSFVLFVALFFAINRAADDYIQPIAVTVMEATVGQPTVAGIAVPPAATLGVIYAAFTATSAVASYYAGPLEDRLGTRGALFGVTVATGLLYVLPTVVPLLAFPLFFAMKSSNALVRPVANGYINDHVESVGRATVLSAAAMVFALVRSPFMLAVGVAADLWTPILGVAMLGGLFLVAGAIVVTWERPVRSGSAAGTSAD